LVQANSSIVSAGPNDSKAENMTERKIWQQLPRAAVLSKDFFDGEHCDSVLSVEEIDLDTNGQQRRPATSGVD
jgi:hypothetical protein